MNELENELEKILKNMGIESKLRNQSTVHDIKTLILTYWISLLLMYLLTIFSNIILSFLLFNLSFIRTKVFSLYFTDIRKLTSMYNTHFTNTLMKFLNI